MLITKANSFGGIPYEAVTKLYEATVLSIITYVVFFPFEVIIIYLALMQYKLGLPINLDFGSILQMRPSLAILAGKPFLIYHGKLYC